jgi:hypothetical protein
MARVCIAVQDAAMVAELCVDKFDFCKSKGQIVVRKAHEEL